MLQHRLALLLVCAIQAAEVLTTRYRKVLTANQCHSLLQTQQKLSKRHAVLPSLGPGPRNVTRAKGRMGTWSKLGTPRYRRTHGDLLEKARSEPSRGVIRNSSRAWASALHQVDVQKRSSSVDSRLGRSMLDRSTSAIAKIMSLHELGNRISLLIVALILFLLLFLANSIVRVMYTSSEPGDHDVEDSIFSTYLGSPVRGAGHNLCPELVVPEGDNGVMERIYSLQSPSQQTPGEMRVESATGEQSLVVLVRTGGVGGALLVLVAPGGAVMASCEELKAEEPKSRRRGKSNLLVRNRSGQAFARILDRGHIEAHIHNGKRLMVPRPAHTGAMTVVNEQSQLVGTVEAPSEEAGHAVHFALRILPGQDLGMILLALLAHSCFERRKTHSAYSQAHAPPLLRIAR